MIYNKTPVLDAVKDSAFKALGSYVTAKAAAAAAPPPPSHSKGTHKRGRGFIPASSINRGRKRPKVSFPIFNKLVERVNCFFSAIQHLSLSSKVQYLMKLDQRLQ